jgi:GMP synthase PP-ATPase subunit
MSREEIQAKMIEDVDDIFNKEVQKAGVDDEKWEIFINKIRKISESEKMGFLADKYQ